MLNPIEMVSELTKSGIEQQQADAIVRVTVAFQDHYISREYLETRLSALEFRFDAKIADMKTSIVMWTAGMMVGQTVLLAGLAKLFFLQGN